MQKHRIQVIQWVLAVIVASLIMNILLGFYNKAAGWIDRDSAATEAIYRPGSTIIKGTEGWGIHEVDHRGYLNDVSELADGYILAVGASHTQGKEVLAGERYTDLLNEWFGYTDEAYVYNVSQDGYLFPYIVKGFTAITSEFPDSKAIIIEIGDTNFSVKSLENALNQRKYDESQDGENIINTLSTAKKLNMMVKEYCPVLSNIDEKINSIKQMNAESDSVAADDFDSDAYRDALDKDIKLMTSVYDGQIIILYHPGVDVVDGGLSIKDDIDTDSIFEEACKENGVVYVDMSGEFLEEYAEDYTVPYGFSNTAIGHGHLNVEGHRMIAEKLFEVLQQLGYGK